MLQASKTRDARLGEWNLLEPRIDAKEVERCCGGEMLYMDFPLANTPRLAETGDAGALGEGSLTAGSLSVLAPEIVGLLALACCVQRRMFLSVVDRDRPPSSLGSGTVLANSAGATILRSKLDRDEWHACSLMLAPLPTALPLWTGGLVGLPVDHEVAHLIPLSRLRLPLAIGLHGPHELDAILHLALPQFVRPNLAGIHQMLPRRHSLLQQRRFNVERALNIALSRSRSSARG
jgi:hypothetical protein